MPQSTSSGGIEVDVLADPPLVTVTGEVDPPLAKELRTVLVGLLSMGRAEADVDLGSGGLDPSLEQVFTDVWALGLVVHLRDPSPTAQELLHLEAS